MGFNSSSLLWCLAFAALFFPLVRSNALVRPDIIVRYPSDFNGKRYSNVTYHRFRTIAPRHAAKSPINPTRTPVLGPRPTPNSLHKRQLPDAQVYQNQVSPPGSPEQQQGYPSNIPAPEPQPGYSYYPQSPAQQPAYTNIPAPDQAGYPSNVPSPEQQPAYPNNIPPAAPQPGYSYYTPSPAQQPAYSNYPAPEQQPAYSNYPAPEQQPAYSNYPAPEQQPAYSNYPAPEQQPAYSNYPAPEQQPAYSDYAPEQQPAYSNYPAPEQPEYTNVQTPEQQPGYPSDIPIDPKGPSGPLMNLTTVPTPGPTLSNTDQPRPDEQEDPNKRPNPEESRLSMIPIGTASPGQQTAVDPNQISRPDEQGYPSNIRPRPEQTGIPSTRPKQDQSTPQSPYLSWEEYVRDGQKAIAHHEYSQTIPDVEKPSKDIYYITEVGYREGAAYSAMPDGAWSLTNLKKYGVEYPVSGIRANESKIDRCYVNVPGGSKTICGRLHDIANNLYAREEGTIITSVAYKEHDYIPKANQLFWSELIWQEWKRVSYTQTTGLRFMVQSSIVNDGTFQTINTALQKVGFEGGGEFAFTPGTPGSPMEEAFRALSGTDNVKGLYYMLGDHSKELEGLNVTKIHTFDSTYGFRYLIIEFARPKV